MSESQQTSTTVTFDVGGTHFNVAQSTIQQFPESMLTTMILDRWEDIQHDGSIDVNPLKVNPIFIERLAEFKLMQPAKRLKFAKPDFMGLGMHCIEFPGPSDYPIINQLLPDGFSENELGLEIGMAIIEINGISMRGKAGKQCKQVLRNIPIDKVTQMSVQRGRPWLQQKTIMKFSHIKTPPKKMQTSNCESG